MYTVYVHINKINNKKYVGITSTDVHTRWKNGYGYSEKLPIGRAFRKYGWDSFEHFIVLVGVSEQIAKDVEKYLIQQWNTQDDRYGYNITAGGDGVIGWHPSEETKRKISEKSQGRFGEKNPNYNHKWTEDMKNRARIQHLKENLSQETLKKYSDAAKLRVGNKNSFYGKKHSDETKRRISEARSRAVQMFDLDGNLIFEFNSIKSASETTGINKVAISNCCRGLTQTSGGYIWKYK